MRYWATCSSLVLAMTWVACDADPLLPGPIHIEPPPFTCPLPRAETAPWPAIESHAESIGALPDGANCRVSEKTMSRLNRTEYENTTRDLLGIDHTLAQDFPDDDTYHGFDNNAEALSLAPLLVEKYFEAARALVDAALDRGLPQPERILYETEDHWPTGNQQVGYRFANEHQKSLPIHIPHTGDYVIRIRAFGQQAGNQPPQLELSVDGGFISLFDVEETSESPGIFESTVRLTQGGHIVSAAFRNDYNRIRTRWRNAQDRALVVDYIELDGPYHPEPGPLPSARTRIMTCSPEESSVQQCAEEIISAFAQRAFRRTVTTSEAQRLSGLVNIALAQGEDFEEGIALALRAILISPEFLFRVERDPIISDGDAFLVDDFALASRLSYFLWSSMPDDRLLQLAEERVLTDPSVLENEIRRMIDSPKSHAFVENFGGQWLQYRALKQASPDGALFPDADALLTDSMQCETELLFHHAFRENLPARDLIDADYTFINQKLAVHYGFERPELTLLPQEDAHPLSRFGKASLEGTQRMGLLTHGAVLMLGSHPDRTSPVLRGKWVLDQLLCMPPPPPPPDVGGFPEESSAGETVRERMEAHRSDPFCASCHVHMDPIGFAFENFDAVGAWRNDENGQSIDASGLFLETHHFDGAKELATLIADDFRLQRCVSEKVLTYALNRGLSEEDACHLDLIRHSETDAPLGLRELVVQIAMSAPFRMRVKQEAAPDRAREVERPQREEAP